MISRFFSNAMPRRFLCVLLALLTCFCALSPALVQPAEAVAVADDILLASLGLLAASWAGITFTTNAGANTAISNLLESKSVVKSSLAALITKNLVVDGAKLLLTSDVRDAFKTVLPDIKDFFKTDSESVASAGGGALVGDSVVGFTFPQPAIKSSADINSLSIFPFTLFNGCRVIMKGKTGTVSVSDSRPGYFYVKYDDGSYDASSVPMSKGGSSVPGGIIFYTNTSGDLVMSNCILSSREYYGHFNSSLTILSSPNSIPFHTSKEVDGTQVEEITWGVVLVPDPTDPTDPSTPTEDGSGKVIPVLPLGPQTDVIQNASDPNLANDDPGLSPEEMIKQLKELLEGQQSGGGGTTEPGTDPSEPSDPGSGGSSGMAPDFNQMMTPTLKDFFPFCIPGDIRDMIQALCADPVAPKFTFATSFMGQLHTVDIDLSPWDSVATVVRYTFKRK